MNEKYVKKSLLGKGSRGTVFLVENKDAGMPAALKWYEENAEEAKREREILRRFGGKGIPYLIDYIETENGAGVVMEYIEGKSLRSLLEEQKIWSEKETVPIIMKAAGILAAFHRQVPGMIYGDVKPENIMVTPEGEVYFVDFGSVLYEGERNRKVFGTREYLPPSEGEKASPYRDTYGLGVIFYEMLTGSVLSKGIADGKADISHLSEMCRQIMQKAVKIHETEGYANGGELYEDLKKYMENTDGEKKGRKRRMGKEKNREKKTYFISDLKRLVCTGAARGICLFLMSLVILGSMWRGNEVEGAIKDVGKEAVSGEEMVIERIAVRTDRERYREGKSEAADGKEESAGKIGGRENKTSGEGTENMEEEMPRDAYGRKLVVRK